MRELYQLLDNPFIQRLGSTLVHFIWQGTIIRLSNLWPPRVSNTVLSDSSLVHQGLNRRNLFGFLSWPGWSELRALADKDQTVEGDDRRYHTALALKFMGPDLKQAIPAFTALLVSGNQETAHAGARALAFQCP